MTSSRTSYHHGDLRAALIDETERMIAANELDQVTLNELGKRLGVARSAPYRHFKNKNELLCEVATRAFERTRDMSRAIRLDPGLSPAEQLRALARAYFQFAVDNPDFYRLMYREGLVGAAESPALAAMREQDFAELAMMLEAAQAQGVIAAGDVETQALFCWAPFHGMASFVVDQHIPKELFLGMLDWTVETILKGLRDGA
jgi:AcrR family transcriptional regulator